MNTLLEQLIALTGRLVTAAGVPQATLAELRRFLAAALIQQNPGFLPVVVNPAGDAAINDAALAGAALAAQLNATGVRLRWLLQPYLCVEAAAYRSSQVLGPFIDDELALVQFSIFETAPFRALIVHLDIFAADVRETALLLPAGTLADADDPRRFVIPAGTVWIRARRLLADAPGYVALRVAGGSLVCSELPRAVEPGGGLEVKFAVIWTLDVQPEPAPPPQPDGSDGAALELLLPTRLVVNSAQPPTVEGALALAGFGTPLRFDTPAAAPVAGSEGIGFPFTGVGPAWSIAANRSAVFQFSGQAQALGAVWTLPLTGTDPAQAGEAAHGGVLEVLLHGGPTSRLAGASGSCQWRDTVLSADARGLELRGRRAGARIAADVVLWGPARSQLRFGADPLGGLRHASRRSGADIATLQGGTAVNRWDLPRAADAAPFPFDGVADALSLIAEADGLRRIACAASVPEPDLNAVRGFVLENLYLHVHPARRMGFVGSGTSAVHALEGAARLLFDVRLAQPMLPDPYGATWSVRHLDFQRAESAFAALLRWAPDAAPALQARLAEQARLSFPREGPVEDNERLRESFDGHLGAQGAAMAMLDLSGHDDLFGVALEPMTDRPVLIDADNRLAVPLRQVRLLMQPQVHWEPVEVIPNKYANTPHAEQVLSRSHGGTSLVGAQADTVVPVLPARVGEMVVRAAQGTRPAAALFSLPFGLRAFVRLERLRLRNRPTGIRTLLHQPVFGDAQAGGLVAATQLRLVATGTSAIFPPRPGAAPLDPKRGLPGQMLQTDSLVLRLPGPGEPPTNSLPNLLGAEIAGMMNTFFQDKVPLHQADLSGHGLSTFSRWRLDPSGKLDVAGVTEVRFDVTVGRTAYEVIEVRSRMLFAQCRMVRTVVMERGNSGRVQRFDSGWNPIDDGSFDRYVPFDTGVCPALRNIRRVRILDQPEISVPGPRGFVWQPVLFDADAQVLGLSAGGANGLVPIHDHPGYIQLRPLQRDDGVLIDVPELIDFEGLLAAIGRPVGGTIDCAIRLGDTLPMQLASLQVDRAVPEPGQLARFFVTVYGSPGLPRAAPWSVVRIDGATQDVSPLDMRRGMPVLRRGADSFYSVIDPVDALARQPRTRYGLLMSTPASRVLYPQPRVQPAAGGVPGRLLTDPPRVADPYALAQASGAFPRPAFVLQCQEAAVFAIDSANDWQQLVPEFSFKPPLPDVAQGADWGLARSLGAANGRIRLGLNTALPALPWDVTAQQPDTLALRLAAFPDDPLFFLDSAFADASQVLPAMKLPTLRFGNPLNDLKEIINTLTQFINLPFDVDVNVAAGTGPSPSFIVRLSLRLRIPGTMNERIDIGVGKFHGLFEVIGQLEAALNGDTHGQLSIEFSGDVQQGILPPLLYAGGAFRFVLQVSDSGPPLIELGLATTTSIGGDLIKNLVELEVTVRYGYTLIPQELKPGVMLGLDARAKLLGGLLGLSFSADAMARIQRLNRDNDLNIITLWCELRVAATVQVAYFLKEEKELRTQFEQDLPLGVFALVAGANPWVALASEVL